MIAYCKCEDQTQIERNISHKYNFLIIIIIIICSSYLH